MPQTLHHISWLSQEFEVVFVAFPVCRFLPSRVSSLAYPSPKICMLKVDEFQGRMREPIAERDCVRVSLTALHTRKVVGVISSVIVISWVRVHFPGLDAAFTVLERLSFWMFVFSCSYSEWVGIFSSNYGWRELSPRERFVPAKGGALLCF